MKNLDSYLRIITEEFKVKFEKEQPDRKPPVFSYVKEDKYIKILRQDYGGHIQAHCFIDDNGNIFMAQSWHNPEKESIGNIKNY